MSRGNLEKRLSALEEVLAARNGLRLGIFMPDPEQDPEQFLDEMISAGRLDPADRHRVLVVRFWSQLEAEQARGRAEQDAQYGRTPLSMQS